MLLPKFIHTFLFSCHHLNQSHHHFLFLRLFTTMTSHSGFLRSFLILFKTFSTEWSFNNLHHIILTPQQFPKYKMPYQTSSSSYGIWLCLSLQTSSRPFFCLAHFALASLAFFQFLECSRLIPPHRSPCFFLYSDYFHLSLHRVLILYVSACQIILQERLSLTILV